MIIVSIAQTKTSFSALREMVSFASRKSPFVDGSIAHWQHKELCLAGDENGQASFDAAAAEMSQWVAEDDVSVLVSEVHPLAMNPLLPGKDSLLAMLILAFPEVRWLFGGIHGYKDEVENKELNDFRNRNGLHLLFAPEQTPLFDGSGLRDWVRKLTKLDASGAAAYLPERKQLAVAVDEESDYAYLHAYTAYRFGFRAMALTQCKAVEAVLGAQAEGEKPDLTLEDLYLNFPDGHPGDSAKHMSNLEDRDIVLHGLSEAKHRILITSGYHSAVNKDIKQINSDHIIKQRAKGKRIRWLHKPHGGIFSIWEDSGLKKRLKHGVAEGYVWPPVWDNTQADSENHGHSSPGVLLQIARHLLNRAERLLAQPITTAEEAVHGAVLATDALELLGGKTPTSAAEALALKHQFAIHAECQFVGVEHRIRLAARFDEIRKDAEAIAYWFRKKERKRAALNIQMDIINRLIAVLRQYNQFDEELECLTRVRNLQNTIFVLAKNKPWRKLSLPLLRYFEFLMASFPRFLFAIFIWTAGVGAVLALDSCCLSTQQIIAASVDAFFANSPYANAGSVSMVFSTIAAVAGIAHLGIFISHLYTLVSRR